MSAPLLLAVAFFVLGLAALGLAAFWVSRSLKKPEPASDPALALLQQQMDALRSQVSETLIRTADVMNKQLGGVTSQVAQSLETTTGQINLRLDNYSKVVQDVSRQLGSLSQATEKIFEATRNISTLEEILKPPKLRGGMGEILLENVLREILPSQEFYTLQYGFKTGNTVDAVIRLKDGLIPVDAKFPLDNFRRMIETKDDKERAVFRKEFVKNLKKHIDDISNKYLLPDEGTFNFALMYVPAENVYYEMVVRNDDGLDDLYSYATSRHVFPVSPNSFYPYLMTLALGFRGLSIEKQAQQILGELAQLHGDLVRFEKDFFTVGDHIADAQKKFNEAEKKLDRIGTKVLSLKEGSPSPGELPLK